MIKINVISGNLYNVTHTNVQWLPYLAALLSLLFVSRCFQRRKTRSQPSALTSTDLFAAMLSTPLRLFRVLFNVNRNNAIRLVSGSMLADVRPLVLSRVWPRAERKIVQHRPYSLLRDAGNAVYCHCRMTTLKSV